MKLISKESYLTLRVSFTKWLEKQSGTSMEKYNFPCLHNPGYLLETNADMGKRRRLFALTKP